MKRILFAILLFFMFTSNSMAYLSEAKNYTIIDVIAGVNTGYSNYPKGTDGFALGGELTVVYFNKGPWYGLGFDYLYDYGIKKNMYSVFAEGGYIFTGIEIGYSAREKDHGFRVGIVFPFVFLTPYVRYYYYPGSSADRHCIMCGVTFKVPLYSVYQVVSYKR